MTGFKGFASEEEAKVFCKTHGGLLTKKYTKSGRKSSTYIDYMYAVKLGGLNEEKYPFCVQWRE